MNVFFLLLALLLAGGMTGCMPPSRHDEVCRDTAHFVGAENAFSLCDEHAQVELHGSVALCRCPRAEKDGGTK